MIPSDCIAVPHGPPPARDEILVTLGSTERRGLWSVARHLRVRVLLGSAALDLREARLADGVTTIEVAVTLGSLALIVPADLPVDVAVSARLGSTDAATGAPIGDGPRVRVIGTTTLGSCEVVRK